MKTILDGWTCGCEGNRAMCRFHELRMTQYLYSDHEGDMRNKLRQQATALGIGDYRTRIVAESTFEPYGGSTLSRQYEQDHWRYDL